MENNINVNRLKEKDLFFFFSLKIKNNKNMYLSSHDLSASVVAAASTI